MLFDCNNHICTIEILYQNTVNLHFCTLFLYIFVLVINVMVLHTFPAFPNPEKQFMPRLRHFHFWRGLRGPQGGPQAALT